MWNFIHENVTCGPSFFICETSFTKISHLVHLFRAGFQSQFSSLQKGSSIPSLKRCIASVKRCTSCITLHRPIPALMDSLNFCFFLLLLLLLVCTYSHISQSKRMFIFPRQSTPHWFPIPLVSISHNGHICGILKHFLAVLGILPCLPNPGG